MGRTSRVLASAVGVLLGATLVVPDARAHVPAAAERQLPPAAERQPAEPRPAQPAGEAVRTATVTLVTGDVVRLSTYPDGRQAATVQRGAASGHRNVTTIERNRHVYVVPDVAQPYLRNGLLDEKLFDVTELVAQGYDDEQARSLPLILEYAADRSKPADTRALLAQPVPTGADKVRDLPSVASVAVGVPRGRSTTFWQAVDDDRPAATARLAPKLDRQLRRIWLDARVTASLDVSVPLVGAPAAWQAGSDGTGVTVAVLDTGIDATHPDLADRVVDARNFSDSPDTRDRVGHGTHVAGTVAGSGTASGGRYKGVAPGAKLLSGKVLGDNGAGPESAVIAGMEWAAARAKVVNMSLGGPFTDGSDPMSQAVNRLSAQHGTLFVAAAGNNGFFFENSVATPGAADAALTVGATTKTDVRASFSGRGPRFGDHALKPEIMAPGVDIVAARAAGTLPNQAVDDRHARLGGTSMASPHVAGAAAILAGRHPDWTGQQLKGLLTSTASPLAAGSVYQQGAGRVDVTRAVTQRVTASTGVLSLGRFLGPYGTVAPVRRTVTYRNDGEAESVLDLTVSATSESGAAAGAELLSVDPATVTVPPGGTAEATVTLDPNHGALGLYGGRLVATGRDGKTVLTTAVGFDKDRKHVVTVNAIAHDGRPARAADVYFWSLGSADYQAVSLAGQPVRVELRPGQHFVFAAVATMDEPGSAATEVAAIALPELSVSGDVELVLDARGAQPVNVSTPHVTEQVSAAHQIFRQVDGVTFGITVDASDKLLVVPGEPATRGFMEYDAQLQLAAPVLTMRIAGPGVHLHPRYLTPPNEAVKRLDGNRRLPAVFVGAGRPDDYVGRDVRGKIAVVRSTPGLSIEDQVVTAAAARAAMVVVLAGAPGVFRPFVRPEVPLPTVGLSQAEGTELLRRLGQGTVTLDLVGIPHSPYHYQVVLPHPVVPNGINHVTDRTNTALQHTSVYAVQPNQFGWTANLVFRPLSRLAAAPTYPRPVPFQQDRYFSAGDTEYSQAIYASFPNDLMVGNFDRFTAGAEVSKTWYKGPLRSGTSAARPPVARNGDQLLLTFDSFIDAEPDHLNGRQGEATAARVYRDGELVAESRYAVGFFDIGTAQPATYRVELDVSRGRPGWVVSPEVYSAWTFRSQRPATSGFVPVPVLMATWDLDLDLTNAAPAGQQFPLRLVASTQPGAPPVPAEAARAWVSFDDGGTWEEVAMSGAADGRFTGAAAHPPLRDTTGFVSLRYEVTDAAGGRLEQTILRAYALK